MDHLEGLNPAQKEAVTHTDGPLLILAGAGAGKTRVITHRILHLIHSGVAPHSILAVTFTNKAAKEMAERVESLLNENKDINRPGRELNSPYVSTFHALGVTILRENWKTLGISKYFTIFDRSDSLRAIKEAIKQAGLDVGQFEPKKILGSISRAKGDGIPLSKYEVDAEGDYYREIVAQCWSKYKKILDNEKALDFDDLLITTVELLDHHPQIKEHYQRRWTHVHVDEYQDTNKVQNMLARHLTSDANNICVVGDVDQTIYTWRGASIRNMLDFEKTFKGAQQILLEENYRSTKTIIAASNEIISKNELRPDKNVFTHNADGDKIHVASLYGEIDEAYFVTGKVKELLAKKVPLNEIAVLYRANFQSRMLEEAFLDSNIPYHVLGIRFFDRKEVKDVLSYIRLALNPDSLTDLKRVINTPKRGIGNTTLLRIVEGKESECSPAMQTKIKDFRDMMKELREVLENEKPSVAIKKLIRITGIERSLIEGKEEDQERLENIKELVTLASKYDRLNEEGMEKLLTDAALATDQDELSKDRDGVKLMTVHASKGLEFDCVFIVGLEEGLFPHEGGEGKIDDEEERRLFYVALTRARKVVYLTNTQMRTIFGATNLNIPSQFITDIDDELLQNETEYMMDRNGGGSDGPMEYLNLDEL